MFKNLIQSIGLSLCTVVAFCAVIWPEPAAAVIGTVDNVPAATLLLPYFESDLDNPNGSQTTVRITNTSAAAMLGHAVLYTDLGIPTMQFSVYFTGYDSVDIDMRLLFKGILPQTASAGQDATDKISPRGAKSQDINFASCSGILPTPGLPPTVFDGTIPLDAAWNSGTLAAIRAAHTGQSSTLWSGQCGAAVHGDNIARGYMTIDSVNACSELMPTDAGYFVPFNYLDERNIMAGTSSSINRTAGTVVTENLVSIEAGGDPQVTTAGVPTFYSRFLTGTDMDQRETLGSIWSARYVKSGVFSGTQLVVWRDPGVVVSPFACGGSLPAPFPLVDRAVVVLDEQEHPVPLVSTTVFPYATQLVDIASFTPNSSGSMILDLDASATVFHQSYVSSRYTSSTGKVVAALPGQLLATQTELYCIANAIPVPDQPFNPTPAPGCENVLYPQSFYSPTYFFGLP